MRLTAFVSVSFVLFAALPAAAAEPTSRTESFVYKQAGDHELSLVAHYPADWKPSDRRPAIVFFFGGGWNHKNFNQFIPQADYLASRGMVALRADYRVKVIEGATPAAGVEDAKSALRWIRQHADKLGIDPARIIAAGGSSGGHIAACTALGAGLDAKSEDASVSSKPCALVLFNPALRFDVPRLLKLIDDDAELGKSISPILHLQRDTVPTLLIFGDQDQWIDDARAFVAKAKETGCRAELYEAPGQVHGFFNRSPWREKTLRRADEFLTSLGYLQGPPTIEVPESDK